jgi:hypothetical protein
MRELIIEIPLSEIPFSDETGARFLTGLMRQAESTYFFRMRGEGFLLICRVPSKASEMLRRSLPAEGPGHFSVAVLNSDESEEILQISGTWDGLITQQDRAGRLVQFIKLAMTKPIYITANPVFRGDMLRISFAADEKTIADLRAEIERADLPVKLVRLGPPRTKEVSPLSDLTARQASILRLAHSMGYYDIPKRAGVEDIGRVLGVDKGTVGEHLRKAEKRVFDRLLM